ncbi:hypothetical protein N9222_02175 [Pseudomonadales bacterium]|nr:hypothetical protein [Pseudomonadales bacterium]
MQDKCRKVNAYRVYRLGCQGRLHGSEKDCKTASARFCRWRDRTPKAESQDHVRSVDFIFDRKTMVVAEGTPLG